MVARMKGKLMYQATVSGEGSSLMKLTAELMMEGFELISTVPYTFVKSAAGDWTVGRYLVIYMK